MRRPSWLRSEWFWDGLCTLAEGSRVAVRRLLRLPARRRSDHKARFPKCHPSVEPLEHRQTMSTVQFNASNFNVGESSSPGVATVNLDTASGVTITVNYATSTGTASTLDYMTTSGMLTFAPGETSKTFNVTITGDSLDEIDETLNLTLSGVTGAGASLGSPSTATMTIQDDDPLPTVGLSSSTYSNGESGSSTITVNLSAASGKTITVDYATSNGTATAGADYTSASGTLTFNPGDTSKTFNVSITGDTTDEDNETVAITLSNNNANANLGTANATLTINDDDAAPTIGFPAFGSSSINEASGQTNLEVRLSAASGKTVTVQYSTTAGTATATTDYTSFGTTTLTFNPGETSKFINVAIVNDTTPEANETFTVNLANPVNTSFSGWSSHTVTIVDTETTGISEYNFSSGAGPWDIVSGPDGNLWATLYAAGKVAKIETDGTITEYDLGGGGPRGLVFGPDGFLYIALESASQIVKFDIDNEVVDDVFNLTSSAAPFDITVGPDGNLWATEPGLNKVAKITTSGTVTEYTLPTSNSNPRGIAAGPDGNLWVALQDVNKIAKVTTSGTVTEYTVPTGSSQPYAIIAGSDGTMWFTEKNATKIGQITTGGVFREQSAVSGLGLTEGPDKNMWVLDGSAMYLVRFNTQTGTYNFFTPFSTGFTQSAPKNLAFGSDGHLWITQYDTGRIARFALGVNATAYTVDVHSGGTLATLTPQGIVQGANFLDPMAHPIVAPANGYLYVTAPLDWRQQSGTGNALVYVSGAAAPQPIIEATWAGDAQGAVPTALDIRLNWNSGGFGSWVSYATTGHSPGDVYLVAIQAPSVITSSGNYSYTVEVKATWSGGYTLTRTFEGKTYVAVQGASVSTAPALASGWGLTGLSKLTTVGSDVVWADATGSRMFISLGSGAYLSPSGDFGTLAQSGGTWAYTSKEQVVTNFNSSGYQTSVLDSHGLYTTYTYTSNRLTGIQDPDGTWVTFNYDMSNRLASINMPGGRTVTTTVDSNGRLTNLTNPSGGGTRTFTYDGSGRMTSEVWDTRRTTFSYAGNGTIGTVAFDASTYDRIMAAPAAALGAATAKYGSDAYGSITDALGHITGYVQDRHGRLTRLTLPDGGVWTYERDGQGQVTRFEDPLNRVTTYGYDYSTTGKGDLTGITFADGSTQEFTYDSTYHKVTTVTNEEGLVTTYTYNGSGDLATVTTPDLQKTTYTWSAGLLSKIEENTGLVTTFLYDGTRRLETTIDSLGNRTTNAFDTAGNVTSITPPVGSITTYAYDAMRRGTSQATTGYGTWTYAYNVQGQVTAATDNFGLIGTSVFDTTGRLSESVDHLGNRTTYLYNAAGQLQTVIDYLGNRTTYTTTYTGSATLESTKDTLGNLTTYTKNQAQETIGKLDTLGNSSSTEFNDRGWMTTSIDTLANRGTTVYLDDGRVDGVQYADGTHTSYIYDAFGRVEATIDRRGNRTTTIYDAQGRVWVTVDAELGRTTTTYDAQNRVSAVTNALNQTTTTLYDTYGRAYVNITPLGFRTTTLFDVYGNTEAIIDPLTNRTSFVYDTNGRQIATIDALNNRTTTQYNASNQVEAIVHADLSRTTFMFDANGRQYVTIDVLGNRTTTLFDSQGRVEATWNPDNTRMTTVYDTQGRVSATIDALGNRNTTIYDTQGRVWATVNALGQRNSNVYDAYGRLEATVDQLGGRTSFAYDGNGNRTVYVDALSNRTTSTFDKLNREVTRTDPLTKTTTFAYDAVGHMTNSTDRLGRQRQFTYDNDGRLTNETWIASNGVTVDARLTFTYDSSNNQLTASNNSGTYTMTYDAMHRVLTVQEPFSVSMTFTYNSLGKRTKVEDSFGGVTTSTYNSASQLTKREFNDGTTQSRVDQTYDAMGRTASQIRYSDLAGTSLVARTSFSYDASGQLTSQHHRDSTGATIANYTYVYDTHGRLTSATDHGLTTTYAYDNADQVTGDGTTTVTYDANGNRNNGSNTVTTGNRLTTDGTWNYTYNDEGNETKKIRISDGLTWTYGYDQRNQMTSAERRTTDGGTLEQRTEFKYDAWGNRIEKRNDSNGDGSYETTNRFALDGWKTGPQRNFIGQENVDVFADLDGSNALQTRYIRGDVIDELFGRVDSGTAFYILTDRQGSVRDVVDTAGVVKDSISYGAFGGIATETNSAFRGWYTYTGRELDPQTGLHYYRRRYYDSFTARWTSQDPLGFDAGDGNLYRYVRNQATNNTDPSGTRIVSAYRVFEGIRSFRWYWQPTSLTTTVDFTQNILKGEYGDYLRLDRIGPDQATLIEMAHGDEGAEKELVRVFNAIDKANSGLPNIPVAGQLFGQEGNCHRWVAGMQEPLNKLPISELGTHFAMKYVVVSYPYKYGGPTHGIVLIKNTQTKEGWGIDGGKWGGWASGGSFGGRDHLFDPWAIVADTSRPKSLRDDIAKAIKDFGVVPPAKVITSIQHWPYG